MKVKYGITPAGAALLLVSGFARAANANICSNAESFKYVDVSNGKVADFSLKTLFRGISENGKCIQLGDLTLYTPDEKTVYIFVTMPNATKIAGINGIFKGIHQLTGNDFNKAVGDIFMEGFSLYVEEKK